MVFAKRVGIGTDIETISRFQLDSVRDTHFLNAIFTSKEQAYCFSKPYPPQHLAARFAAKEAIFKALSSLSHPKTLTYTDIQIVNDSQGAPSIVITQEGFQDLDLSLSLSHNKDNALAFVAAILH